MPLLLDTGVIYALADQSDAWHARTLSLVTRSRQALITPATVLPEAAYLLRERLGPTAELAFVRSVARAELVVESLRAGDYTRAVQVMAEYPEIGFVDASVVAVAERLELRTLATTDRRHFAAIRPRHAPAFLLVP
jgi:predicted nucleic acid-binding protein